MSDKKRQQFTFEDIQQWVEEGLISPTQAVAVRQYVADKGAVADRTGGVERRTGLNLVSIAYYFGAFMILLAYTIFMGLQWQSLGLNGQFAVSLITLAVLFAAGAWLRKAGFVTAGGLLIFAGTGIVPLLVYTFMQAFGIFPRNAPNSYEYAYREFYSRVAPLWIWMELISMLVAVFVIWAIRFPLVALLIAFWWWYLSMDLTRAVSNSPNAWTDPQQIISSLSGVAMLALGIYLQRRATKDYSRWFYLFGHIIILSHLGALTYAKEGILGIVFLVAYLGFVVTSVWLQRKTFLVFGAIGCYVYVSYLAFRVFQGSLGFVFALATLGLVVVLTAVAYQKFVRSWLDARLSPYRINAPQAAESSA